MLLAVLAHPDDESYGIGGTLARYAAEGIDVHVAIATDGAAGSTDEKWKGDHARLAEVRAEELANASRILGVAVHQLGYRDSGYIGDPANDHPAAFVNADEEEAAGKVVGLIRQIRPRVVITHDETGGYRHPDHIQCHRVTRKAFFAAGDPDQFPEIGPAPFHPEKLYYSAFSKRWTQFYAFLLRLQGRNPSRMGRNNDIDLTWFGVPPETITTSVDYRKYWETKRLASAAHVSQGGGTSFGQLIPTWLQKLIFSNETFIRDYPPPQPGEREKGLFNA